jgi:large subunit ribosomal protein L33
MAKNDKRVKITLACEDCKRRNYITMKSKVNDRERIEMKKYCRWDKRHTVHKETRYPQAAAGWGSPGPAARCA